MLQGGDKNIDARGHIVEPGGKRDGFHAHTGMWIGRGATGRPAVVTTGGA
ncbi:MAG: hypothetical protein J6386_16265 [Candidatus Synoicihabitans palmerolidicus]|nr:hypothetical protein [Candidatus Synoicihabitans palmerolidicus]